MIYQHHGLALGIIIAETEIPVGLDVDLSWPVDLIVIRDGKPIELTHIEKESVEYPHLLLVDLLDNLLGLCTFSGEVKV